MPFFTPRERKFTARNRILLSSLSLDYINSIISIDQLNLFPPFDNNIHTGLKDRKKKGKKEAREWKISEIGASVRIQRGFYRSNVEGSLLLRNEARWRKGWSIKRKLITKEKGEKVGGGKLEGDSRGSASRYRAIETASEIYI